MSETLGHECYLYVSDDDGATWTEVAKVRDNELNLSSNEIDSTSREVARNGWRGKRAGLREWGVSFDMLYDNTDSAFGILKTAFMAGTALGVKVLDGAKDVVGSQGLTGQAYVTDFKRGEPLDNNATQSVTIVGNGKGADGTGSASWVAESA